MWYSPEKYDKEFDNLNDQFLALKGELEDKEAKISLAKFLRANLGFTTELISGIKLAAYQEATLKGMMNRNFSMCVWGRGCGKTFIASVFCFLQCIFEPGTKILIAGPTFRTARFIFNNLEKRPEILPPGYVDDFTGTVLAFQLSNRSAYLGYSLTMNTGFRWERRVYEVDTETNSLLFIRVFAGLQQ